MATVFRPPLIARREPTYPSAAANMQPWRGANIALELAPQAAPPKPIEWSNPQIPRYSVHLRTWFNFATTPITTPVSGFDWINTRSVAPQQPQSNLPNVCLLFTLPPQIPQGVRGSLDQPNPILPDRFSVFRYQQFPNFRALPVPNTKPFLNVDWPVPVGPRYSVALRIFSNDVFEANRLPPRGTTGYPNTLSISVLSVHRLGF